MNLVERVFGTHSDRELKLIYPIVNKIEKLRPQMQAMSDEELRDQTSKFKERLAKGERLDDILPEAYAAVREAAFPPNLPVMTAAAVAVGHIRHTMTPSNTL